MTLNNFFFNGKSVSSSGVVFIFTGFFLIFLCFILLKNRSPDQIHRRLVAYKTFEVFKGVRLAGKEMQRIRLSSQDNNVLACGKYCLQNKECLVANYFSGKSSHAEEGQCYLYHRVDLSRLSFDHPSYNLAVYRKNNALIQQIQTKVNKWSYSGRKLG